MAFLLLAGSLPLSTFAQSPETSTLTKPVTQIIIFRPRRTVLMRGIKPDIYLDGHRVARKFSNGRFLSLPLSPGRHTIAFTEKYVLGSTERGALASPDMSEGETVYFEMRFVMGAQGWEPRLTSVTADYAQPVIAKLKPSEAEPSDSKSGEARE